MNCKAFAVKNIPPVFKSIDEPYNVLLIESVVIVGILEIPVTLNLLEISPPLPLNTVARPVVD